MQVFRAVRLFSIERQMHEDAWLNNAPSLKIKERAGQVAEMVRKEVSRFVHESGDAPSAIRMSYWSLFELPRDQWELFPCMINDERVVIPVIADSKVVPGRIHCMGSEETVRREAART